MGKKIKVTMSLDGDLLMWVSQMVELKRFASRTHAIEFALQRLRERSPEELHVGIIDEKLAQYSDQDFLRSTKKIREA